MLEDPNLPELVNRFRTALKLGNAPDGTLVISQIFAELDSHIETARNDYARVVREANRNWLLARDAETKRKQHDNAVAAALQQNDREAAIRQVQTRDEHARNVAHHQSLAQEYNEQARLQRERQDELSGLREDLRRTYQSVEAKAIVASLDLRYQDHLDAYRRLEQELEGAREQIRSMQINAFDRAAQLRTDPVLDGKLLEQKSRRRAAEEEIDRRMNNPNE